MASENSMFRSIKSTAIALSVCIGALSAQTKVALDSVFRAVYDKDLKQVNICNLNAKKPVVIVSSTNCTGCVTYFVNASKNYEFVFIISSFSLMEVNRIQQTYKLHKKNLFFATAKNVGTVTDALLRSPTPCLYYSGEFYDYSELSIISGEFSLKPKLLMRKLNGYLTIVQ